MSLRSLLSLVCSRRTMDRLVDPVLADIDAEPHRPRWRGYLALARALVVHAALSLPGSAARLWVDDHHAVPRAIAASAATALVLAAALLIIPASSWSGPWQVMLLLLPQGLAFTLPVSLLIAIPLAFRRTVASRRLIVRGVLFSAICAAATMALLNGVMPGANQAFRVEVAQIVAPRPMQIERGPGEMTLNELRERIATLSLTPGGIRAARRLEYVFQQRLAIGTTAVPIGLLAIAIALSKRGRARPLLTGACGIGGYLVTLVSMQVAMGLLFAQFEALPAVLVVWIPVAALLLLGLGALNRAVRRPQAISA